MDDALRSLGMKRSSWCLLLSGAAKCMVAADAILQSLYPKLLHVICVAHLLHNRAMKVKFHFKDVNELIAKSKSAKVETKKQAKFATIGFPAQPVVTRWGMLSYIM